MEQMETCAYCNVKVKHLNRNQGKVSLQGYEYLTKKLYKSS